MRPLHFYLRLCLASLRLGVKSFSRKDTKAQREDYFRRPLNWRTWYMKASRRVRVWVCSWPS